MQPFAHAPHWTRRLAGAATVCALAALGACNDDSGGGAGNNRSAIVQDYSIAAKISGLNSTGLVLQVDIHATSDQNRGLGLGRASQLLALSCPQCNWVIPASTMVSVPAASTSEQLAVSVVPGASYSVTIQQQPLGEICNVQDGSGTIQGVSSVVVSCTDQSYTVGGSITGLTANGLTLLDNAGDALTLDANATQFTMKTPIAYGSNYAITVQTAPTGLVCDVSNGAGTMAAADVTNITVGCLPNFTLLHSFVGGSSDGSQPYHSLIQAADGVFYGTSWYGGTSNGGVVFAVTAGGTASVFYSFAATPFSGLMQASDGNFYGTTANGGISGDGTVFKLTLQ